ncbi:prepilin-type N-terminal cleavage/methylation domain-containing protein [Clostridium acetobutylicum]|nr:prepilin-type N-terminal cleavage/methylation domain-containing protein [Clostridium acetobutylicum]
MWKLRNKKGFTLIEVMCSFSIFSILFLFAVNLKVDELKMGKN